MILPSLISRNAIASAHLHRWLNGIFPRQGMPGTQTDSALSTTVPDKLSWVRQNEAWSRSAAFPGLLEDSRGKLNRRAEIDAVVADEAIGPDTEILGGLAEGDNDASAGFQVWRDENWDVRRPGTRANGQT